MPRTTYAGALRSRAVRERRGVATGISVILTCWYNRSGEAEHAVAGRATRGDRLSAAFRELDVQLVQHALEDPEDALAAETVPSSGRQCPLFAVHGAEHDHDGLGVHSLEP